MPLKFEAKNIISINPLHFELKGGVVTGLICSCEVNYGEMGMNHQIDIWEELTPGQRQRAQALYDFIRSKVEGVVMGGD